ncbi:MULTISPECIES: phytanoyl-CoA dioxygenase family protein [unclassified Endozoicomonas]|uniref:phytanoyl-CoA dioxygenase family protein n=1 Tax=unclassified Endozoicomonas TaxID=2644528 RepID=UPI00214802AF|nr:MULTISPECIES: phytanoyl-CoA dioxygenase family protein [unclassified Endozoicomonas]
MLTLSKENRRQLSKDGYTVIPDAVPQSLCDDAIDLITQFLDIDLCNPQSWYEKDLGYNGLVPVHQHQSLWNIRQHPNIHALFTQLLGTEKLWVRMDRLSFKPPSLDPETDQLKSHIHLDFPAEKLTSLRLQGILYLTETRKNQGAFCCVPSLFKKDEVLKHRESLWFSEEELSEHPIEPIEGEAGSLIIWDSGLPHSGMLNISDKPRLAVYISMFPAGLEETAEERIELWQEKRAPKKWRGLNHQQDPEPGEPARLTELGKKLLGLEEYT